MNNPRARLREMLAKPEMIIAPFVFDCIQAKLAVSAGFDAVYMTGFGTAAARGYPDLGLVTMTEMVDNVRAISRAANTPVIATRTPATEIRSTFGAPCANTRTRERRRCISKTRFFRSDAVFLRASR